MQASHRWWNVSELKIIQGLSIKYALRACRKANEKHKETHLQIPCRTTRLESSDKISAKERKNPCSHPRWAR